jgi:hypothetical protein
MAMMMMDSPAKTELSQLELDQKEDFSAAQIEKFKNDPELYNRFVKTIERDLNGAFAAVTSLVSPVQPLGC